MENNIEFLKPEKLHFYFSDTGLLKLRLNDEEIGRVAVIRMFPFKYEEEYLSIRTETYSSKDREGEIGLIRNLSDFECEQAEIIRSELKKRYFIPEIFEVYSVRDELGNTVWDVNTNAGKREFTVNDMNRNVRNAGNNTVFLTDVYGNRYSIPDITKIDDKTMKVLEIWI